MRHVAVAGAGIGGLAAALALARAGCRVSVFERTPVLAEVGAGLQLSPNATAALRRLGVLTLVERDAVAPLCLRIGTGRNGAVLARLPLREVAERRFGAPFLVTRRADLHRALHQAARDHPGITVATGRTLLGWTQTAGGLLLGFEDPETQSVMVDALVGCDGLHSVVRDRLGFESPQKSGGPGRTAWRATLEARAAPPQFREPNSNLWLGGKAHLVHYPVAGGRLINVIAAVDEGRAAGQEAATWSTPGDPAEIRTRFASWAEPIRTLLAAAESWGKWPLFDRPPLARWSCGPVTLLGDAAHPMLPFLAQGAAQAIEDAVALGEAVAAHADDLETAFRAYEAARRPRTARIQAHSRRQAAIYHLPPPASALRDLVLRLTPGDRLLARYDWLYAAQS